MADEATPKAVELAFKFGDRIKLTQEAVTFYGGVWPHFVPEGQGGGGEGTVVEVGDRPYKYGAAPRPYYVHWDNGVGNSYRNEDLRQADEVLVNIAHLLLSAHAEAKAKRQETGAAAMEAEAKPADVKPIAAIAKPVAGEAEGGEAGEASRADSAEVGYPKIVPFSGRGK